MDAATERTAVYPTNAYGLTYGTEADLPTGVVRPQDTPDPIAVESSGRPGYVYAYALNGGPQAWVTNPSQALENMNRNRTRTLTAFESDGVAEVGVHRPARPARAPGAGAAPPAAGEAVHRGQGRDPGAAD